MIEGWTKDERKFQAFGYKLSTIWVQVAMLKAALKNQTGSKQILKELLLHFYAKATTWQG